MEKDYLGEAKEILDSSRYPSEETYQSFAGIDAQLAIAYALIAIAEQLKKINENLGSISWATGYRG